MRDEWNIDTKKKGRRRKGKGGMGRKCKFHIYIYISQNTKNTKGKPAGPLKTMTCLHSMQTDAFFP